jgi:uridylate kinase
MKYKRILLKLSGESAGGPDGTGIDAAVLTGYASQIRDIVEAGCQVAIVIGGGNIFRGWEAPATVMTGSRETRWACLPP